AVPPEDTEIVPPRFLVPGRRGVGIKTREGLRIDLQRVPQASRMGAEGGVEQGGRPQRGKQCNPDGSQPGGRGPNTLRFGELVFWAVPAAARAPGEEKGHEERREEQGRARLRRLHQPDGYAGGNGPAREGRSSPRPHA